MNLLTQAAILMTLTVAAATGTHFLHPKAPAWYLDQQPLGEDEVTLGDITQRWQGQVQWIDARPRSDFEKAHVPGAWLLNEQEADVLMFDLFEKLQDNDKPLIVYCSGEACQASRKIRQYLKERVGSQEIYVLRGGWAEAQKLATGGQ